MFNQFGTVAFQIAPQAKHHHLNDLWSEPSIDEMMADEAIRKMMARDGISEVDLRALMTRSLIRIL